VPDNFLGTILQSVRPEIVLGFRTQRFTLHRMHNVTRIGGLRVLLTVAQIRESGWDLPSRVNDILNATCHMAMFPIVIFRTFSLADIFDIGNVVAQESFDLFLPGIGADDVDEVVQLTWGSAS
jgi:hypothetical protein